MGEAQFMAPPDQPGREETVSPQDQRRRALATGFELAKNAIRAKSLDEVEFVLVNDTRTLLPFDRALLIVHFQGESRLVAASNQPRLEQKSDFVQRVNALSRLLKPVQRGLILFPGTVKPEGIPDESAQALLDYVAYSRCSSLVLVPLSTHEEVIGHLIFEFYGDAAPGEVETFSLMNVVPFFSAALAEKWVLDKDPRVRDSYFKSISTDTSAQKKTRLFRQRLAAGIVAVLIVVLFFLPLTLTIGGHAEVVPDYEYFAYAGMEGIVDKVFVKEGEAVKKDQVVARLEEKEIQFKIREHMRAVESLKAEMEILRNQAAESPSKLADSQLVAIKMVRAKQELDFLRWQSQFLNIQAPVDGLVLTKKVESLIGKRFKAGEPFCRFAPPHSLLLEMLVKEEDVSYVKKDQLGSVFFNFQPNTAFPIRVHTISPKSDTVEHVGGVFRVRAAFEKMPPQLRPGMMGIGHIDTEPASLWFILTRQLRIRLNELSLYY
jgi:hypothetical protein